MAVNVLRNTVNQLRGSRQLYPGARVNLFSMDRQQGITVLQYYSITEAITAKKVRPKNFIIYIIYILYI